MWNGPAIGDCRRYSTHFRIGRSGVIRIRLISAIVATLALFVASPDGASAQTGTTTNTQTSGVPPAARPPLAGSSTPSMSRVTGRQDLGLYDPYLGTKVFNSATPPPGNLYGR
jgi:hypothetical protein